MQFEEEVQESCATAGLHHKDGSSKANQYPGNSRGSKPALRAILFFLAPGNIPRNRLYRFPYESHAEFLFLCINYMTKNFSVKYWILLVV